jgi:hypothetical protein
MGGTTGQEREAWRASVDEGLKSILGADPQSSAYQGAKLFAEILGTAGLGPAISSVLKGATAGTAAAPAVAPLAAAIETGGLGAQAAGGATGTVGLATRMTGGALAGGAAGLAVEGQEGLGLAAGFGAALPAVARPAKAVLDGLYQGIVKPFTQTRELSEDILADTLGKYLQETPEAIVRGGRAAATPGFERTLPETIEAGGGRAT